MKLQTLISLTLPVNLTLERRNDLIQYLHHPADSGTDNTIECHILSFTTDKLLQVGFTFKNATTFSHHGCLQVVGFF